MTGAVCLDLPEAKASILTLQFVVKNEISIWDRCVNKNHRYLQRQSRVHNTVQKSIDLAESLAKGKTAYKFEIDLSEDMPPSI
jgi:hypothetical protein